MAAERVRYWRDDPNFSHAVVEAVAPRRFAARVRNFHQRLELRHPLQDLLQPHHDLRRPHPVFFQRHEFDKAHDNVFVARELAKPSDLSVVEPAQQHAIHFDRIQSRPLRCPDSRQHILETVGHARDARECLRLHRVHTDSDAG